MKIYDLYDALVAALPPEHIDHHESDLYVKVTKESRRLIDTAGIRVETFVDQITHTLWYDIPLGYTPFWEAIAERSTKGA